MFAGIQRVAQYKSLITGALQLYNVCGIFPISTKDYYKFSGDIYDSYKNGSLHMQCHNV